MIHDDPNHVYVIAEAGVNHNGDRDLAFALVDEAANAGADAVKFQTFNATKLTSKSAPKAAYQKRNTNADESQLAMLKRLELSQDWHVQLQSHATKRGIEFISTAFDDDSLDFLVELNIPFFKVPSGELTNAPLLWKFARTLKPLVISTGMATLAEVEQGLAIVAHALTVQTEPKNMNEVLRNWSNPIAREALKGHVSLLHCTSQYPTPFNEVNLLAMDTLRDAFGLPVGYSDHTEGILIPVVAAARGARIIEKHFTTDRTLSGPDHAASLEPNELTKMISDIRNIQNCFGTRHKVPQESEWDTRQAARQQLVAARDITKGVVLTRADMSTARCGQGLAPSELWGFIGTVAQRDYAVGEVIERN